MADGVLPTAFPMAGGELETLHGALERIRSTFAWKCGGLGAADLRVTLGPSSLTLGGLLKHLAFVEDDTFTRTLLGQELPSVWDAADGDAFRWAFSSALEDPADELMSLWQGSVARSRIAVAKAVADGGVDGVAERELFGEPVNLRRLLVDVNEEYARHTGHADLIRESIDGLVGEDPPQS